MFAKISNQIKRAVPLVIVLTVLFCNRTIYGETIDATYRELEVTTEQLESGLEATVVSGMSANWYDDISMVVDKENNPHIIYRNSQKRLELADTNDGSWRAITIGESLTGGWNSIFMDEDGYFHISSSRNDSSDEDLLYITDKGGWQQQDANKVSNLSIGLENDIALDSKGNVHISHHQWNGGGQLYTTNKNGDWETSVLDEESELRQTSIAIDSNDNVYILYGGVSILLDSNKLAVLDANAGEWTIQELPGLTSSSEMVMRNNELHIVSRRGSDLCYANSQDGFQEHLISQFKNQFMNTKIFEDKPSIAVDSNSYVHIVTIANDGYDGDSIVYLTNRSGQWQEFLIDRSLGCHNPAIATDTKGNVHIAYSEDDGLTNDYGYYYNRIVKYVTFNPSELTLPDKLLSGLCYGPYREGQSPNLGIHPSLEEIDEDLLFISELTPYIRTFGIDNNLANIPELCYKKGLNCFAGVWLSDSNSLNEQALENALNLIREEHYSLIGIVVGNEAVYSGALTALEVAGYINDLKQKIKDNEDYISPKPGCITTAEPWSTWLNNPELAEASDIIMANVYPYWEGVGIEDAASYVVEKYNELDAAYGKRVIISETGWPTAGATIGNAVPSVENQERFLLEFTKLAEESKIPYFWFEAFDESWKASSEGEAGAHWGLVDANRNIKDSLKAIVPTKSSSLNNNIAGK
jgi:exo-beta-1,3-glucanase (GH17 family)